MGTVSPALAELVDMYPTLSELAGLTLPVGATAGPYAYLGGTSLVPVLRGEPFLQPSPVPCAIVLHGRFAALITVFGVLATDQERGCRCRRRRPAGDVAQVKNATISQFPRCWQNNTHASGHKVRSVAMSRQCCQPAAPSSFHFGVGGPVGAEKRCQQVAEIVSYRSATKTTGRRAGSR